MRFYQNYLNNIAQSPYEQHLGDMQNFIWQNWENSTQNTGENNNLFATQQDEIGSDKYIPVEISIDMQMDLSTGSKISDDYKVFTHQNLRDNTIRGLMYEFSDNFWLTTDTSEIASPIKSVGVRRCNQQLKWIDPKDGELFTEWCVLDYDISSPNPKVDKDIITPSAHAVLVVQGNDRTHRIERNSRFIFNRQPFKVSSYNNMLQNGIVDNSTTLLYFDLYLDEVQPSDDLAYNIANGFDYIYSIDIIQNPIEQVKGFVGRLDAVIKLNNKIIDKTPYWESNENAFIHGDGEYTLIGDVGTTAILTASWGMEKATVEIKIVDVVEDKYELVIEPPITELNQGQSIDISAMLYKNGVEQTDIVDVVVSGADNDKCYSFIQIDVNKWKLTNNFRSIKPLDILFESGEYTKILTIQLKSIF